MFRPSDVSALAGVSRSNVVRYQAVPGFGSAYGIETDAQPASGYPARCQPARSPYRPLSLTKPRTVSVMSSPPWLPWIFQLIGAVAPVNVTDVRPRAFLNASLAPPSSSCPIALTITESSCGPSVLRASGMLNVAVWLQVAVVACPDVGTGVWLEPRNWPSSHACSRPTVPVWNASRTWVAAAAPEYVPRYQTGPLWKP